MSASAQNADSRGNTICASTHDAGKGWIDMNRDRIHGIWKQFSGKVKEQWGTFANDPLAVTAGTRDQIAGRIQNQYGTSKQEADRQLHDFMIRNRNWRDLTRH